MRTVRFMLMLMALCVLAYGTISSTDTKVSYACDDSDTEFAFTFPVTASGDIVVALLTESSGDETILTETTHYTVAAASGGYDDGGTVTTIETYSTSYTLVIYRELDLTQDADLSDASVLRLETLEDALDRLTMLDQQQGEVINRSLRIPITDSGITTELASSVDRASKYFACDVDGDFLWSEGTTDLPGPNVSDYSGTLKLADIITKEGPWIDVRAYGATGDGATDDTAAIQAALAYAATFVIDNDAYDSQHSGGIEVIIPKGVFITSETIVLAPGVSLRGAGKMSTAIQNTATDGSIIRNSLGTVYNNFGSNISDLSIFGSRSLDSQYGIDLLRAINCTYSNIYIQNCGAANIRLRQCVSNTFDSVYVTLSVGPGFLLGCGVNSWSDPTSNSLPSNANRFTNCYGNRNDGAGVRLDPYCNGNVFYNSVFENNYYTAGANVGYNIELLNTGSYMVNEFVDCWVEGPVQAHVYQNALAVTNRLTRLHHFGNGASGNVDRAVIAYSGTVIINESRGHSDAYKTISGSNAPFRLNKANTGLIFLRNPMGSTLTNVGPWVEDENYSTSTGFYNYLKSNIFGYKYGDQVYTSGDTEKNAEYYSEGESYPRITIDAYNKQIKFGGGSSAPDTNLYRESANNLRTDDTMNAAGFNIVGYENAAVFYENETVTYVD